MYDLNGKVGIITGGNSGIGKATAIALANLGVTVVIGARREKDGNETVRTILKNGGQAHFIKTDVSKEDDVKALINTTVRKFGKLDYAFNNSGISGAGAPSTTQLTLSDWNELIATNLIGVWLCMKYEIEVMLLQGQGSIVNNSSTSGLVGDLSTSAAYTATKHAVIGLTKHAALEYGSHGIRINAVCPAWIDTPMTSSTPGGISASVIEAHALGRIGYPHEVAEATVWLLSDAASFITGQAIPVDGGYLAK